ncbi:antirestriction protein [Duganella sp. FT109W]|uniref:Antirestriction protein n=1 Tax=Duganella margarita TaxID=2692170 RepID=A0ABW9WH91_9BURK|nr:antirestriction protein [Duganella margarita]MYN40391.1 antirestriction protein [Duganella margarita]
MDHDQQVLAAPEAESGLITAQLVPCEQRLNFLPQRFGPHFLLAENTIYDTMGRLCSAYTGGFWAFYLLSNGGAFMAPTDALAYHVECEGNGYEGWLEATVAGMGVTAMALNRLSFMHGGARYADLFYRLREYISQQPQARQLFALLD